MSSSPRTVKRFEPDLGGMVKTASLHKAHVLYLSVFYKTLKRQLSQSDGNSLLVGIYKSSFFYDTESRFRLAASATKKKTFITEEIFKLHLYNQ